MTPDFVSAVLRQNFPESAIQQGEKKEAVEKLDSSKVQQELKLQPHDPAATLVDMAKSAVQLGIVRS